MGVMSWRRNADRPAYNGEDVSDFNSTSYYYPRDIFDDTFNPWFGEPDDNGIYFDDTNHFDFETV
jgi:hypothetical protein